MQKLEPIEIAEACMYEYVHSAHCTSVQKLMDPRVPCENDEFTKFYGMLSETVERTMTALQRVSLPTFQCRLVFFSCRRPVFQTSQCLHVKSSFCQEFLQLFLTFQCTGARQYMLALNRHVDFLDDWNMQGFLPTSMLSSSHYRFSYFSLLMHPRRLFVNAWHCRWRIDVFP